jgi:hypothetical protein
MILILIVVVPFFFFFFACDMENFTQILPVSSFYKNKNFALTKLDFFFFTLDEERDGAPKRETGIKLERERKMVHRRGLVFSVGLGWTLVPSIGSYGLGSGKITIAAEEKDKGEGEK